MAMLQRILEESITQVYPIGLRHAEGDSVFRYCQAGEALRPIFEGHNGHMCCQGVTDAVVYPIGTRDITVQMNANSINNANEVLQNFWRDGHIWIMDAVYNPLVTGTGRFHRIRSNVAAIGNFITMTLYEPLTEAVTATRWITAWPNIYSRVMGVDARMSLVCLPLIPVQADYYFWGLTWGPCFLLCGYDPGRTPNDREVHYSAPHVGMIPGSEAHAGGVPPQPPQRIGRLLANTNAFTDWDGNPELGGDNFFMLELAP